ARYTAVRTTARPAGLGFAARTSARGGGIGRGDDDLPDLPIRFEPAVRVLHGVQREVRVDCRGEGAGREVLRDRRDGALAARGIGEHWTERVALEANLLPQHAARVQL